MFAANVILVNVVAEVVVVAHVVMAIEGMASVRMALAALSSDGVEHQANIALALGPLRLLQRRHHPQLLLLLLHLSKQCVPHHAQRLVVELVEPGAAAHPALPPFWRGMQMDTRSEAALIG